MTYNGGRPHNVGYSGQRWAIVVDVVQEHGPVMPTILGWSPDNAQDLAGLNISPSWSNARYELVTDPRGGTSVVPR